MPRTQELDNILLNAKISYFLHYTVDFDNFKNLDFNKFYKKIKEVEFGRNLTRNILDEIENTKRVNVSKYIEIIKKSLEEICTKAL